MLELIEDKEDTDYLEECIIRQVSRVCDIRTHLLLVTSSQQRKQLCSSLTIPVEKHETMVYDKPKQHLRMRLHCNVNLKLFFVILTFLASEFIDRFVLNRMNRR